MAGNPGVRWSWKEHAGRVLGFFCFDATFLARPDFSADRFAFFLSTLRALRDELREAGGDLLVLDRSPDEAFGALFAALTKRERRLPATISFNRDYEPFARARDERMSRFFEGAGVRVETARDHLLLEPGEVLRADGGAGLYKVYSPFAKRWFETLAKPAFARRLAEQGEGLAWLRDRAAGKPVPRLFSRTWSDVLGDDSGLPDQLERYAEKNGAAVRVPLPEAGSTAAWRRLQAFRKELPSYKEGRDFPARAATSRLSLYFKNGSLTTGQVAAELGLAEASFGAGTAASTFLRELVWREFYYQVLWYRPRVEKESFLPQYRDLAWENREDWFAAWKEGRTGFPLVDAGMRELAETGFMHNRVRMVVASFLTRHLLLDWRLGEAHFMAELLDGQLSQNDGNWQWVAGTGADAQPFHRIFSPTRQGERFDPEGAYVRRWVPELARVPARAVHAPWALGRAERRALCPDYPPPVVELAAGRARALAAFELARSHRGGGTSPRRSG